LADAPETKAGIVDTDVSACAAVVGVGRLIDAAHFAANETGARRAGAAGDVAEAVAAFSIELTGALVG
jgi:hypothetical protein